MGNSQTWYRVAPIICCVFESSACWIHFEYGSSQGGEHEDFCGVWGGYIWTIWREYMVNAQNLCAKLGGNF